MPGEEELGESKAVSAWALAGDPETQARPGSLSLLVAEVCTFIGLWGVTTTNLLVRAGK